MRLFLKVLATFFLSSLLITICILLSYMYLNKLTISDAPAINIANEYSFNEKMLFLNKSNKNAEIISMGSSMSLNNLNSSVVVDRLNSKAYINTASWGMSIKDDFLFLKLIYPIYQPKTLIISSNIIDFQNEPKKIKYDVLENYLVSTGFKSQFYYFKTLNLKYFADSYKYAREVRSLPENYKYLGFDQYGGVNLNGENFVIREERWNDYYLNRTILPDHYDYLDSISVFCKNRKIHLLFFQSPFRQGLYSEFNKAELDILTLHTNKVAGILKRDHHIFINANDTLWDDQLFIDGTHFNRVGTEKYTRYCFDQLRAGSSKGTVQIADSMNN